MWGEVGQGGGAGERAGAGRSESGSRKVSFHQLRKQALPHNPERPLCQNWEEVLAFTSGFSSRFIVMRGAVSQSAFPHRKMQISFLVEDS